MAKRPIPDQLKILRGTFRKSRANKGVKLAAITNVPNPPRYLSRYSRKLWRSLSGYLVDNKLLAAPHLPLLEALCEAYGLYRESQEAIYTHMVDGKRVRRTLLEYLEDKSSHQLSAYRIMKSVFQDFRLLLIEFGLTPVAAGKLSLLPDSDPGLEIDPIEKMLNETDN